MSNDAHSHPESKFAPDLELQRQRPNCQGTSSHSSFGTSASNGAGADAGDAMTPDSDEDSEAGYPRHFPVGEDVYELQDRSGSRLHFKGLDRVDEHDDAESEGEPYDEVAQRDIEVWRGSKARKKRRRRRGSGSTAASFQLYTPDEEREVVRKFDRRLVVFVAGLYMLSFLDRSIDIGNARVAGMDEDLQPTPGRGSEWYEWALTAFYLTYIGFEWMALLWRVIPAHIYVTALVLSWGVAASLQAVAVNYPMLIFLRAFLGTGEAGFTGVPFYLSFFFKRRELAFRTAIFVSAAPLATTFASSLAWLIMKLGESSPIASWRLLFLVEGFPSVVMAAVAWHVIPDSPETAPYLTQRQRKVARLRLRKEKPRHATREKKLRARDVLAVFTDPVAWLTAAIFFLTNMAYSSLPVFLPTILTAMGHSALSAQALAAPPYLAAFLIVLTTAHASDVVAARSPWLIAHALFSAAGYGVLAITSSSFLRLEPGSLIRYLAVYPATIGFFNVVVLTVAWSLNNQRGEARQGGGFALLQAVGQCGPLVGTRLYPDREGPYYERGMTACAAAMLAVAVLAGGLRWYLWRLNRRLGEAEDHKSGEGEALVAGGKEEDVFRYML